MFFDPAFGYTANSFNRNRVTNMTYKKTLAALVAGTLTAFGAGAYDVTVDSVAHKSPHTMEALKHAEQAVVHGKQGHADVLVEHAEEALKQAIMAQKEFSSYKLQNAATHLQEAITEGKKGDAKVATTHAEEAVKVLKSDVPKDSTQP
ncbi:MAG: metal-binding protein SmbP [Gammaproteobacteria bacterium]|nr:metal-binding protein SmbP [Gammaproteobacteria bacterium]